MKRYNDVEEICKDLAKKEGKKSEVSIGNIREIVKLIAILLHQNPHARTVLGKYGRKAANQPGIVDAPLVERVKKAVNKAVRKKTKKKTKRKKK